MKPEMYSIRFLETLEHLGLVSLDIDLMLLPNHQHLQSEPADGHDDKS
mgnify:CR=1 FL=1